MNWFRISVSGQQQKDAGDQIVLSHLGADRAGVILSNSALYASLSPYRPKLNFASFKPPN